MWVYGLLLIIVFAMLIALATFIVRISYKAIRKRVKSKAICILLSALVLFPFALVLFIDTANVIAIYSHLFVITLFTKLILKIIEKRTYKEHGTYTYLIIGMVMTSVVMIFAYLSFYNVKQTNYSIESSKNVGNLSIVQISDSHLGKTMSAKRFEEYIDKINELHPNIVVITGDFIDDGTSYEEMIKGTNALGKLYTKYGTYFSYGNHDKGYYSRKDYNDSDFRAALVSNHVVILEDDHIEINNKFVLIGRNDAQYKNRKSIYDLVTDIDMNKYIIVLDHQPNDYDNEANANVDLVLSGHTHGGQMIPLGQLGVLLGANDKTYGMETRGNTTFIVNSGISDWAFVFKTGTSSEYSYISIKGDI